YWNPSPQFAQAIQPNLGLVNDVNLFDYIYSSDMPEQAAITRALGFAPEDVGVCLTPSATAAELLVALLLKAVGVRRVHLATPHYFAAGYALSAVGLV